MAKRYKFQLNFENVLEGSLIKFMSIVYFEHSNSHYVSANELGFGEKIPPVELNHTEGWDPQWAFTIGLTYQDSVLYEAQFGFGVPKEEPVSMDFYLGIEEPGNLKKLRLQAKQTALHGDEKYFYLRKVEDL